MNKIYIIILIVLLSSFIKKDNDNFFDFIVDPQKSNIQLFYKDDNNVIINNLDRLKKYIESKGKHLKFAMNGGMFMENYSPTGLFIQKQKTIKKINLFAKNSGIFYITTNNIVNICKNSDYINNQNINFATQSQPMLLINKEINSIYKKGTSNIDIRNGVGILPDNKVMFVISTQLVNFYDFAEHFKKAGCINALYLDGGISMMYENGNTYGISNGQFGILIAIFN